MKSHVEFREQLRALPKAELHLHLEGSINAAALLRLSERHGHPLGLRTREDCQRLYSFRDFPGFIQAFKAVSQHLIGPEDYALAVEELGRALAAQGVVYAEVFLSIGVLHWKKMPIGPVWEAVEQARIHVERQRGVRLAWIFDAVRQFGRDAAERVVDEAILRMSDKSVVGIGIGGDEQTGPAHEFAATFARAHAEGLGLTAHAGETCGPKSIWDAVQQLGAHRIGHGLSAMVDPELVSYLRDHEIYIDICPTSNIKTGCVPTLSAHPARRFFEADLKASISTDDPGIFDVDLLDEFDNCHNYLAFNLSMIRTAMRNGFLGSFLGRSQRERYLQDFDARWAEAMLAERG